MIILAAVDTNWGIGFKGELQIHNIDDLKRFKELTSGNVVIYGKKTMATFPGGKPLRGRINIILDHESDNIQLSENVYMVNSIDEAFSCLDKISSKQEKEVYIIGGGSVYSQFLKYANMAIITKWERQYDADTFLENLDKLDNWECILSEKVQSEQGNFEVCTYVNKEKEKYI